MCPLHLKLVHVHVSKDMYPISIDSVPSGSESEYMTWGQDDLNFGWPPIHKHMDRRPCETM